MFVRISGRILINASSSNAQGAIGNFIELNKVLVLRRTGEGFELAEAPAVSGNMLKHWHFVTTMELLKQEGERGFCEYCGRGVGYRTPLSRGDDESQYIECPGEDLHGFLMPDRQVRRESLVKFAFALPVEDGNVESGVQSITHNRVVANERGRIEAEGMMPFKRQYASALYGFAVAMDLPYVGKRTSSADREPVIDRERRRRRAKCAVLALLHMLSGAVGASQSRSLPAASPVEIVALASEKPLPMAVHGFYSDYVEQCAKLFKSYSGALGVSVRVYTYPSDMTGKFEGGNLSARGFDDWAELIKSLAEDVEAAID